MRSASDIDVAGRRVPAGAARDAGFRPCTAAMETGRQAISLVMRDLRIVAVIAIAVALLYAMIALDTRAATTLRNEPCDRVVTVAGITARPDDAWILQAGRNLTDRESGALRAKQYLRLIAKRSTPSNFDG